MNILIIEDEVKVAKELKLMVENIKADIQVIHTIASVKIAIKWLAENPTPDLILSDIQLADGLSFEIFKAININVPVIFCTAFDHYAITAFEANSIDYLLKPIEEQKLKSAIEKYDRLKDFFSGSEAKYGKQIASLLQQVNSNYKSALLVHFQNKIIPVKTADIKFIYSAAGIVSLYTRQHEKYYLSQILEDLELQLNPQQFFKANRQFIINRDIIQTVEHFFTRRLAVRLSCEVPENIIISKVRAPEFLKWMEG
ncbi:MAG: LytTR family DNA-binding domain-containing protein [Taibaiella sp.]|jgi:DNA-binding LytR/AlgR family response regulator